MSTTVLILALVAALACPAHMLWHTRRAKRSGAATGGCFGGGEEPAGRQLSARHDAVAAELARRQTGAPARVEEVRS